MTRINCIPVSELTHNHLLGENHEITRVFGLVKSAQLRGINKINFRQKYNVPKEYTLGKGHVIFYYDKLGYIVTRYNQLQQEMKNRGFKVNTISDDILLDGIRKEWFGNYEPTEEAMKINRERIKERLQK